MVEVAKRNLLLTLFNDEFQLLLIVRNNDLNSVVNGDKFLCISDCWPKLEAVLDRPVRRAYLADKCQRLVSHGFFVQDNGVGGRKNLKLSPAVCKIFDGFDELAGVLK